MAIQTLTQFETEQASGAFLNLFNSLCQAFCGTTFNFDQATNTGSANGSFTTPFGVFSGVGSANPEGGSRSVNYTGPFGNFGNTAGFNTTSGFNFANTGF